MKRGKELEAMNKDDYNNEYSSATGAQNVSSNSKKMALASLILGIASIPTSFMCGLGSITGVPAIVLGAISKRSDKRGKTGMILGIIGYALSMIVSLVISMLDIFSPMLEHNLNSNDYGIGNYGEINTEAISGDIDKAIAVMGSDRTTMVIYSTPKNFKIDREYSREEESYFMSQSGNMLVYKINTYADQISLEEYMDSNLESEIMNGQVLNQEINTITDASGREWLVYEYSHDAISVTTYILTYATKLDNGEIIEVSYMGIEEPFDMDTYAGYIEPSCLEIAE